LTEVAPARPSSTVVLVREGAVAPEILMVRRHARLSFGASYAFPGGVLDKADSKVHDRCGGICAASADRLLGVRGGGLDYFSAAIRELFEETGVLLAQSSLSENEQQQARNQLNDGSLRWNEFLSNAALRLQCDSLHYVSFWVTPISQPKRYSTRFFVAALPSGQHAMHDGGELTDSCWMPAAKVLEANRDERMSLIYPTQKTLETVGEHESVDELMNWAKTSAEDGVPCTFPQMIDVNGKQHTVLPGEPGYEESGR